MSKGTEAKTKESKQTKTTLPTLSWKLQAVIVVDAKSEARSSKRWGSRSINNGQSCKGWTLLCRRVKDRQWQAIFTLK